MPGFHLAVYNIPAAGVNTVNADLTAATDQDFTTRNGHYTFTEPYRLAAIMAVGASVIRGRFQIPTWNGLGEWNIFNANRSLQPPSNPQWDWYGRKGPPVPMNEEVQVQLSNNLGAATEIENAGLLLLTPDWTPQLVPGIATLIVRANVTVTPPLNAWSFANVITLSANLRGGVYVVHGATLQGSNAAFFRLNFPRFKLQNGRKLRPGLPIQNAIGDTLSNQLEPWQMALGEWGRFHTFELPSVDVFGTAAVGTTYQLFMWLTYLGEDPSLLQGGLGGGGMGYASGVTQQNLAFGPNPATY